MRNLKLTTERIAKICNVSQGTVDRALNNRPDIKAETKQKILNVVKQYGYREDISEPSDKIHDLIGIIVFNLNNEYFADLITEIEYALKEEETAAVVMMSHYDRQYEIECIRSLYNMGVKGIILCSVNGGEEFENYLKLFDIPIVAVGNKIDGVPYVGIDDFAAMREMTKRVLAQNPRELIYYSPALNYPDAYAQRKRYEGFLNAVGSRSRTVVTELSELCGKYDEGTTVICSNDYYALKVYFKGCGARIVGFDNISIIDKYGLKIDSVGYSVAEIAREAIDMIKTGSRKDRIVNHFISERN